MAYRDIIVIGCSAGGVEALARLIAALSPKLNASIFVAMHMKPDVPSHLPQLLKNPAFDIRAATDGEPIKPNTVYIAIPDHHLLIEQGRVRLSRGPKENRARPSVDALFRSAAFAAEQRVIGIVLTGYLDDGTAGLWSIKDHGGVVIVQSPEEAAYPSMPRSALAHVAVDHVLHLDEMPGQLLTLSEEQFPKQEAHLMPDETLKTEVRIAFEDSAFEQGFRALGDASLFTCPECHGSMVRIKQGSIERFRCHTGHAFSALALANGGLSAVEASLWAALAHLEEHYAIIEELQGTSPKQSVAEGKLSQHAIEIKNLMQRVRELVHDPALRPKP